MKFCSKCKENKSNKEFGKDKREKDNLSAFCKNCVNEKRRNWRKDNPVKAKEQDKRGRISNFEQRKEYRKKYHRINTEQRREYKKKYHPQWCKHNPEKVRAGQLKYKYNLTPDDYEKMLEEQNRMCAICGETERVRSRLSIDHDHVTGKVRELVCSRCNTAMGFLDDSSIKTSKMADYLKRHSR